ncbi:hypothetical protein GCM10010174_03270 [Kutzneria viridogrisea]|uniref:Uncharacterized protein n=1 Tax=Kutzneria viridogrisea TaxID=47990 RepID=A0ABR6BRC5_9PSEU|nr:hypothetical protein [Kutzneria viridogrisea]
MTGEVFPVIRRFVIATDELVIADGVEFDGGPAVLCPRRNRSLLIHVHGVEALPAATGALLRWLDAPRARPPPSSTVPQIP